VALLAFVVLSNATTTPQSACFQALRSHSNMRSEKTMPAMISDRPLNYKHCHASLCLVLPAVGSARSAILLLECIEHFIGSALFSNPEIQIQVCSPGRLDARRSALLAIGVYLGSDTLRRYTLGDVATSFAEH